MPLIKTFIFTILVPGTVTVYVPYILLQSSRAGISQIGFLQYFGIVPIAIGVASYLWCAWDFSMRGKGTPAPMDPPKELVAHGLYRYVRNPMYVGVVSIILGEALWFASSRLLAYAAIVFSFFFVFVLIYEEPTLRAKFGESYRRYCRMVPRWIPRLTISELR